MAEPPATDTQLREQLDVIKAHYDELLAEAHRLHGLAFNKCRELARDFSGLKKTVEEQKTLIASQDHQIADLRFQLGIVRQDDHISDLRFKVGLIRQDVDNTMREDKWLRAAIVIGSVKTIADIPYNHCHGLVSHNNAFHYVMIPSQSWYTE